MTYDAMYKDFVAKAATRVFAQMVGCSLDKHEFNIFGVWNDHADKIHHIARMAAKSACALAAELEEEWESQEQNTAFFEHEMTWAEQRRIEFEGMMRAIRRKKENQP